MMGRVDHNKEVTMLAAVKEYREEIEKKARREEADKLNLIYATLFKQGRVDDVRRSAEDPEYLKQIMAEFGYSADGEKIEK